MDWAAIERILINYGVPLVILFVVGWALWAALWRMARWVKPHLEDWFAEEKQLKTELTKTAATNSQALLDQSPVLSRVESGVASLNHNQSDRESLVSNWHTNRKLDAVLANHERAWHVALLLLEAIKPQHPEMAAKFNEAIEALEMIEKDSTRGR